MSDHPTNPPVPTIPRRGTVRPRLTGAKATMLYTLYFRARDARTPRPLVDDRWAQPILNGVDTNRFRLWLHAGDRHMILLRARQLDRWTTDFLTTHPDALVLQLGCGLDSRAYRLDLPETVHWYDIDFPDVIELRRQLYPDKPNHHTIPSSITEPDWLDELPEGRPTLVIAEGVLPYVAEADLRRLIDRLMGLVGEGQLMFDGVAPSLARFVPWFRWGIGDSAALENWNVRLELVESQSVLQDWRSIPSPFYRALTGGTFAIPAGRDSLRMMRYRF